MDGWKSYLVDLEKSGSVERALIAKLDSKDFAVTSQWKFDWNEVYSLDLLMEDPTADSICTIQDVQYSIFRQSEGMVAEGQSISSQPTKLISVGRTKKYVIVGVSSADVDDGKCTKEVQWITDHIATEGY